MKCVYIIFETFQRQHYFVFRSKGFIMTPKIFRIHRDSIYWGGGWFYDCSRKRIFFESFYVPFRTTFYSWASWFNCRLDCFPVNNAIRVRASAMEVPRVELYRPGRVNTNSWGYEKYPICWDKPLLAAFCSANCLAQWTKQLASRMPGTRVCVYRNVVYLGPQRIHKSDYFGVNLVRLFPGSVKHTWEKKCVPTLFCG
jgi:hypothetical protein